MIASFKTARELLMVSDLFLISEISEIKCCMLFIENEDKQMWLPPT